MSQFCQVAESKWKLGEKDEIEDDAAYTMQEARTLVQMLTDWPPLPSQSQSRWLPWHL